LRGEAIQQADEAELVGKTQAVVIAPALLDLRHIRIAQGSLLT
jgi:hypothetical protein